MVDVQTVSIAIASAGVFAAAVYYILQIRNQTRIRKTDLLVRLFSMTMTKDFGEAWEKVLGEREILEYRDYWKKYGFVEVDEVFWFFEQLGRLLQKRLIDIDLLPIPYGQVRVAWEKMTPIVIGAREYFNEPKLAQGFEYLYNEMKMREQRGVKNG
jgi:hypothetical protein